MSSFYVAKSNKTWRVMEQLYSDGKKLPGKTVPKTAYEALGINPSWSMERVRAEIKRINKSNSAERNTAAGAARRVAHLKVVDSVFLPKAECIEFFEKLKSKNFGTEAHGRRILSHWLYVQKMLAYLMIEPLDYADESDRVFKYFIKNNNSYDYSNKLLRILNQWGQFLCKKRGQKYEVVKAPRGQIKQKIDESYQDSKGFVGESDPLTPSLLTASKDKLKAPGNYEWLYISVWFGLRPIEVDGLTNDKLYRIETRKDVDILWVYQSKLTSIERDKRWKGIPVIQPEQKRGLEYIKSQTFKKPAYKTMWAVFGHNISLYGGRKNFEDLMFNLNYKIEDIAAWMGHQSIETTWKKYRNRKRVSFAKAD